MAVGVFGGEQTRDGNVLDLWIGDVLVQISKPQLHRFNQAVQGRFAIVSHRLEVKTLNDVQREQGSDALSVGRNFVDIVAAIVRRNRLHPIRGVVSEILHRE